MSLKHGATIRTREGIRNGREKVSWERLFKLVQKKSRNGLQVNKTLLRNSSYWFRSS
jgi:hypothetical protein